MITIGSITKPQGVRGEVKVRALTDDPSRFCLLKTVCIGGKDYKISSVRVSGADVYMKLAGVDDRDDAERLRGEFVTIDRAAAVAVEEGEFFIADLIGAQLYTRSADGEAFEKQIGIIKSVESFGAADVFTVLCANGKNMTFAFVKALDAVFDSGRLSVLRNRLDEVAVYED